MVEVISLGVFLLRMVTPRYWCSVRTSKPVSLSDRYFGFLHGYMAGGRSLARVKYLITKKQVPDSGEYADLIKLLSGSGRPRAVFCQGDILAASVLRAAAHLGLAVPGDLAVMGATGLKIAEHTSPPLTVLSQSMTAFGKEVAAFVLEQIRTGRESLPGSALKSPNGNGGEITVEGDRPRGYGEKECPLAFSGLLDSIAGSRGN